MDSFHDFFRSRQFGLLLSSNDLPQFPTADNALWRRVEVVKFVNYPDSANTNQSHQQNQQSHIGIDRTALDIK